MQRWFCETPWTAQPRTTIARLRLRRYMLHFSYDREEVVCLFGMDLKWIDATVESEENEQPSATLDLPWLDFVRSKPPPLAVRLEEV